MRPPANTFLRCSTFGKKKGSNSTPASRCLPRLCSIGEQSGERGLLRVANGATFTKSLVRASPPRCLALLLLCVNKERERERDLLRFFLPYLAYYSFFVERTDSLRFLCLRCQRPVVSTTVFASPTYFCSHVLALESLLLSFFRPSRFIECHLVNNESDEFLRDFV